MTCIRLESANTEAARRTIELTRFTPDIHPCSNAIETKFAKSRYSRDEISIDDGNIPMHYVRARQ